MSDITRARFDFSRFPYDFDHGRRVVGGEGLIFHCHHYNTYLQRSIQDAEYVDTRPILVGAAAECNAQFSQLFSELGGVSERQALVEELYRACGFGLLPLAGLDNMGGKVHTPCSHYSIGWKEKFGISPTPVALFTTGFLAGVWAAIHDLPLQDVRCEQTSCVSTGAAEDVFEVSRGACNFTLFEARRPVALSTVPPDTEVPTSVDRGAITQAITGLPLEADGRGLIPAFTVYLTRMYADYYNRISFAYEDALIRSVGTPGFEVSRNLFIESGHVCAFHTFGGVMTSPEWDAMIRPALVNPEDWICAMVAVVNAFGWGVWKVLEVSPEGARFRIYNDYESLGYERMYGQSDHGISYLAAGGTAGLLNLVYVGDIASKPDLTPEFYQRLFKPDVGVYRSEMTHCKAQGHPYSEFRVTRS